MNQNLDAKNFRSSPALRSAMRCLDLIDLYMMKALSEGQRLTDIAKFLELSQAAVSVRVRKVESTLAVALLLRNKPGTNLTAEGRRVCAQVKLSLIALEQIEFIASESPSSTSPPRIDHF